MEKMTKIKIRKLVPIVGLINVGKSKFLNVLYNFNFLDCRPGICTRFVNIIRYNPYIKCPCLNHLNIVKEDNDYIFYKDPKTETIFGEEKITKEIENINNKLKDKFKVEYEDLFYMTEINEAPFFIDKEYLLSHDLCDIPGLNETNLENDIIVKKDISMNNEIRDKDDIFYKTKKDIDIEKDISINNEIRDEDDIFYKINIENESSYITKIFNIIKNYIEEAIIVLSVENYYQKENYELIAKLHKVTQTKMSNFLIVLNKIDLSSNQDEDIEKCKGLLVQHFPKFKTFNINLNTFIAISTYQLQNELLMSKDFKYLINYHFFNYASYIKKEKNWNTHITKTFLDRLANILKIERLNKIEIKKRVKELNVWENIDQINKELQLIVLNLKNIFIDSDLKIGINENDFKNNEDNDSLNFDSDNFNDNDSNNDDKENLEPVYIFKMLYILHHEKKLHLFL